MACAQHLDDRLPWLGEEGIEPVLLSSTCGEKWPQWRHVRAPALAPSGLRFELRHWAKRHPARIGVTLVAGAGQLLLAPFYLLEKLVVNLDSQWSWCLSAALRGWRLCRRLKPAVIYSTGGPVSAHVAAGLLAKWTGTPWVAEFQDPLVYPGLLRRGWARRAYEWTERFVGRRARLVVFLTEGARQRAVQRAGMTARSCVIYPGADPAKVPRAVKGGRKDICHFAHFGTLGGTRNLNTFLQALAALLTAQPQWQDRIRVHQYGHADRAALDAVRRFPHRQVIEHHGRVPRAQALEAMARSDVLLLVQNTEPISAETIPSKLYEYFIAGRPILGLIDGNQELEAMLIARGHLVVEASAVPDIQQGIAAAFRHWMDDGLWVGAAGQPQPPEVCSPSSSSISRRFPTAHEIPPDRSADMVSVLKARPRKAGIMPVLQSAGYERSGLGNEAPTPGKPEPPHVGCYRSAVGLPIAGTQSTMPYTTQAAVRQLIAQVTSSCRVAPGASVCRPC